MSYCTLEEVPNNMIVVQLPDGDIEKMHIEEYVKGVVPCEMPALWPMAALEAQAICARTYGLAQKGRHKNQGFDVCSTTHCQVYSDARHERTDLAVERTWSIVGMYDGKIQPMWFSASCGGQTKENFWPNSFLRVRDDCPCGKPVNGHQNGLCQWGAKELAERGKLWKEILDFYYDLEYLDNYGVAEYEMDPNLAEQLLDLTNVVAEVEARGLNNMGLLGQTINDTGKQLATLHQQDEEIANRITSLADNVIAHKDNVFADMTALEADVDTVMADLRVLAPLIKLLGGDSA